METLRYIDKVVLIFFTTYYYINGVLRPLIGIKRFVSIGNINTLDSITETLFCFDFKSLSCWTLQKCFNNLF